jgi:hypothetical protein
MLEKPAEPKKAAASYQVQIKIGDEAVPYVWVYRMNRSPSHKQPLRIKSFEFKRTTSGVAEIPGPPRIPWSASDDERADSKAERQDFL